MKNDDCKIINIYNNYFDRRKCYNIVLIGIEHFLIVIFIT